MGELSQQCDEQILKWQKIDYPLLIHDLCRELLRGAAANPADACWLRSSGVLTRSLCFYRASGVRSRRVGNVQRLVNEMDKDDDMTTYNGNSTQQM